MKLYIKKRILDKAEKISRETFYPYKMEGKQTFYSLQIAVESL